MRLDPPAEEPTLVTTPGPGSDRLRDASERAVRARRARMADAPRSMGQEKSRSIAPVKDTEPEAIPADRHEGLQRGLNVAVAALGLLVTMPVLVVVAILIKLGSRGPVLYTQTRVGLDRRWRRTLSIRETRLEDLGGQVFTIYKLRTMRVDAERGSGAVWAKENDPRVTGLGKFLRKYRIDEVPQLWNVIVGDMNVVGPRPERPSIVARLREDIPSYRYRHRVRPGLTGLAQINQKYDSCLDDVKAKVAWDLRYVREQSFWLDLKVMAQTFPSVLLKFQGW